MKIFYVSAGAAHIIGAHRAWLSGVDDPSQVSVTFSSQVAEFVRDSDSTALFLSFGREAERFDDGRIVLEHRPFAAKGGAGFYIGEMRKAALALSAARRFGADVALIDSGALSWFALPMFRLAGLPVIPILHNVLWPAGFPPRGVTGTAKAALDWPFWKLSSGPALGVSDEACRQVEAVRGVGRGPVLRFFPQFRRDYFAAIPPAPPRDGPLTMLFVGRAVNEKGLALLPAIAASVERRRPGAARWIVCGDGPDLPALRATVTAQGMDRLFDIRGWTTPAEMPAVYAEVHATIVPTMSGFREGLAMTAVEAVLAGRPIVTNPVVPALDDLRAAAMTAIPDDAESHADAVLSLADDRALYERLQAATPALTARFYDPAYGLRATLLRAVRG